jgi:hypothetical protein
MKGNPGDGPFFRFPNRHPHVGDLWFCADCQSLVLHAWRLMPLARYEEQVAELKATVERELGGLREEKERLQGVEQREVEAVQLARAATERAELAEEAAAALRNEVASTNAAMIAVTDELRAAKSGSYTERALDARFDRIAAIVAENAGPAAEMDGARKRAPRTATAKGAA